MLLLNFLILFFYFVLWKDHLAIVMSFAVVWEPARIIKTETVVTFCSYAHTISSVMIQPPRFTFLSPNSCSFH